MSDMKTKLLDDLTGLLAGLGVAGQGVREEIEELVRSRLEAILRAGDFVTREEFEAVRAMAVAAREENADLRAQIDELKRGGKKSTKKSLPKGKKGG